MADRRKAARKREGPTGRMAQHPSLASGFPAFGANEWRALAGGAPRKLGGTWTDDGLTIAPLYPRSTAGGVLWSRPDHRPWAIVQRIAAESIDGTMEHLGADVGGGADIAELVFQETGHPLSGQVPAAVAADLARSLAIPDNSTFALRIDAGEETTNVAEAFVGHLRRGTVLSLSLDPIALLAARGRLARSVDDLTRDAADRARRWDRPGSAVLLADGRIWHAAGASEVQELAAVLATYVAHLRSLEAGGFALGWAAERIGLALAADVDQFLTVAKFRAMRLLHGRVAELANLPRERGVIHAETAWRMTSRRDPRTNLLRATTAAFAAAVGGADSIAVLPYDLSDLSDDGGAHAHRLARNTQLILAAESHVGATADPSAGSGAVEDLTDALAAAAWAAFQQIEAEGGMAASVRGGAIQRRIAAVREERLARIARGEARLVGVNAFRAEEESAMRAARPAQYAASGAAETAEPLVFTRLSESFESDDSDSWRTAS